MLPSCSCLQAQVLLYKHSAANLRCCDVDEWSWPYARCDVCVSLHKLQAEASAGGRYSVVTELMLRLLGLDYVANTMVGL